MGEGESLPEPTWGEGVVVKSGENFSGISPNFKLWLTTCFEGMVH